MSHEPKPVPINFFAPSNVFSSVFTLPTLHPLKSEFISLAESKVWDREVAEVVTHLLKPAPTNVAAVGLPFSTFAPPSFRCLEKA